VTSEVQVDKWSPSTGVAGTIGDSGDTFTVPSGATLAIASGATIANSGTATGMGLFSSYAIIADQKAAGTSGGTFTSGAWRTRDLNTEITDPDGIVSISSDQFTLAAGTYLIKWLAPAYKCNSHQTRLYNVTDTAEVAVGNTSWTYQADSSVQTSSSGAARTVITGSKAFTIEHQCEYTSATNGLGVNFAATTVQFTLVEIFKEA
jgi:hypothetical protein